MMKHILLFLLSLVLISCTKTATEATILQGKAFGTTYAIQYFSETEFDAEKGIDSIIYTVNKSVSTYLPKSDISKINQGDTTVVTDTIFRDVYRVSETVFKASDGYFDPTVGILRNAYGFGDMAPIVEIDSVVLDSLRRFVGFNKVQLLDDGRVRKQYPEIYFDFNAVAKGYGIDRIGAFLEANGVTDYLIELGGELLAKGINQSKQQPWIVGIEAVDSDIENRSYKATIRLENSGMASSGNYRKFRINPRTGKKYVHTINPHTGFAQESDVTSAAVVAPTCALADAYATAFMSMGFESAKNIAEQIVGVEAYLTYLDDSDTPQVFMTAGFEALLVE